MVIEAKEGFFVDQQATAAGFVLEVFDLGDEFAIMVEEGVFSRQFALDEGRPDEDFTGFFKVDAAVVHLAPFDQGQPVQDHPLKGHHLAAVFLPMGFRVHGTAQVFPQTPRSIPVRW